MYKIRNNEDCSGDTIPVTVEYELTKSGHAFRKVLDVMLEWGLEHCKRVIYKKK
ncbi:winged helix-turn-helix transcriptional regulator [Niastella sp. OAS944]|uniref:winged helix-turn-helix transcriptional regulator n=1 Tax=Niastella sp. OAS944 TaxID=2664089 RepID=UPI0035C82D77